MPTSTSHQHMHSRSHQEDIRLTTSCRREQPSLTPLSPQTPLTLCHTLLPVILLSPIKIYMSLISVTVCPECWLSSSTAFH